MVAWYIVHDQELDMDVNRVIKYALAHDLVEIYAGDTPINEQDKAYVGSKERREAEAAERIRNEFPDFTELHDLIDSYELRKDKESRFVYALDKILPPMIIYLERGHSWKKNKMTLEMVSDHKKDKVVVSPEVKALYDELIVHLKGEENELFAR
jgi:putative hydrolase of HD superfamily